MKIKKILIFKKLMNIKIKDIIIDITNINASKLHKNKDDNILVYIHQKYKNINIKDDKIKIDKLEINIYNNINNMNLNTKSLLQNKNIKLNFFIYIGPNKNIVCGQIYDTLYDIFDFISKYNVNINKKPPYKSSTNISNIQSKKYEINICFILSEYSYYLKILLNYILIIYYLSFFKNNGDYLIINYIYINKISINKNMLPYVFIDMNKNKFNINYIKSYENNNIYDINIDINKN